KKNSLAALTDGAGLARIFRGLEPALLLFLRGLACGALLLDEFELAGLFLFLQRGCELEFLARLALGGFRGFAQRALGCLPGFPRIALGLEAGFLDAPRFQFDLFLRALF